MSRRHRRSKKKNNKGYTDFGIVQFRRKANQNDVNNFLNYLEFYGFASQFVKDKRVADPGCSSGYSSNVLWEVGKAAVVYACDASKHAVKFARLHFCEFAEFTNQSMSDLKGYPDDCIDVAISSEVLEHIKEYQMEEKVISEIRRIVCDRGIIIVGTPNSELLGDHGFYFDEIDGLFKKIFKQYCIFENALVPFVERKKEAGIKRLSKGKIGVIVSENINLSETDLSFRASSAVVLELKKGIESGLFKFASLNIDTTRLHNTTSWVIFAVNEKS